MLIVQVEGLLEKSNLTPAGEGPGPDTELDYWRQQMSRFNSVTEQLKSHECRLVLGVTSMMHSQVRAPCNDGEYTSRRHHHSGTMGC